MRYYEGHELAYQRLKQKGSTSWDEFRGQAPDFDSFCMRPFIEETLARATFESEHPVALEIGCGTGPLSCFLAARGFQVEGIDISSTAVELARACAQERGLNIGYRAADVVRDPLPQAHYDLVVDGHCLHCIILASERLSVLQNIYESLRPGGQFWLDTMIACETTDFGDNALLDDDGILWVKVSQPGNYDLEKQLEGATYVANRRVYREARRLEVELEAVGFELVWSRTAPPDEEGHPASFQGICRKKG